jgi:tetratricopeptide (TPR) repeat protein
MVQNDPDERAHARVCFEESLSLARETGDEPLIGLNLNGLGEHARLAGELGRARELYEQALEIHRRENHPYAAYCLFNLGVVAFDQEDVDGARGFFAESLTLLRALGDRVSVAYGLGLAGVHAVRGGAERAARILGAAEALRTAVNEPVQAIDRSDYERWPPSSPRVLGPENGSLPRLENLIGADRRR